MWEIKNAGGVPPPALLQLLECYWLVCADPTTSSTIRLPLSNFTFLPGDVMTEPLAALDVSEFSCRFFNPITPLEVLVKAPFAPTVFPAVCPTAPVVAPT